MSYPAVIVEVQDGITGAYIARDAKGVITDGTYRDSLQYHDVTQWQPILIVRSLAAGFGRGGTYDIEIKHKGYQTWTRSNVEVPAGPCNPETQYLDARMKPEQNQ